MTSDGREHRCQVLQLWADGASLRAPLQAHKGETVLCYLDEFGRVQGRVTRLTEDGFTVAFDTTADKRARMEAQLSRRPALPGSDAPLERLEFKGRRVVLTLPDGRLMAVQVLDLSRSGASLICQAPPAVGAAVRLGRRPARVSRSMQRLVGVTFDTLLPEEEFGPDIMF